MKKLLVLAAFIFAGALCANANAQEPIVGTYANDIGTITIAPAKSGEKANYDVSIMDKSGKCQINIVAATYNVTAQGKNGATFHPNAIVAVESATYPNFSLWPEDQTIKLADEALPLNKLDPACAAFKGNMTFTRK